VQLPVSAIPWRAFVLGVASGGRSTAGLAAVAATTLTGSGSGAQPLTALSTVAGKRITALMLLGELVADKLPSTPRRLAPPALLGRVVTGGLAAWALAQRHHAQPEQAVIAGAAGAAGAVLGSIVGLRWRAAAARRGLVDLPAALVEDAIVLGLAAAATTT
jgi:uncharacterized membrane protein